MEGKEVRFGIANSALLPPSLPTPAVERLTMYTIH